MRRIALACLVVFSCLSAAAKSPEEKKASIEYLRKLQSDGGGFVPAAGEKQPSLRATTAALRALKYFGGGPKDRAGCAKFVAACFNKESGGFTERPGEGKPDVFTTSVGIMAVVDLKMPAEKYTGPAVKYLANKAKTFDEVRIAAAALEAVKRRPMVAQDWLKTLAEMRNADGTFGKGEGKARFTGGAVVAELRLGRKVKDKKAVLKALKAGQRPDGGFGNEGVQGSDLGTTYRVMRCFHMLKERPDAAKMRAFVAKCRNADGGYGVTPGAKSNVGATYYASIILHWLDEDDEKKPNPPGPLSAGSRNLLSDGNVPPERR